MAQKLFDVFLANLPMALTILGMLGAYRIAAAIGRKLWSDLKALVLKTPNKLDDVAFAALDPSVAHLLDLIERGDLPAIKAQAAVVRPKLTSLNVARRGVLVGNKP